MLEWVALLFLGDLPDPGIEPARSSQVTASRGPGRRARAGPAAASLPLLPAWLLREAVLN